MKVTPYLHFSGRCKEAFEFYAERLNGKILFSMTWGEAPGTNVSPEDKTKIMHATLSVGGSEIAGADMPGRDAATHQGFSLALAPESVDEAERMFQALAEGGQVNVPLQQTFWAARFGEVTDRFGISWMISCEQRQEYQA